MKKILKQPLVHFLLVGLGFFVLFQLLGDQNSGADTKTIIVDKEALMTQLQYRSKAFNTSVFETKLASMPETELKNMINDYIKEEVLYREAKAMGMDRNDYIIKKRMIQKVEFIAQGVSEATTELTDEDIQQYFEDNKSDYYIQPYASFAHIYYDLEKRGKEEALAAAQKELNHINTSKLPFHKASSRGDRFLYHTNYVEREPDYVASHFGKSMAKQIFEAVPSKEKWIGPFESPYGYHLVMLIQKEESRTPQLAEIKDRVTEDANRWLIRQNNEKSIQEIIDGYDIKLIYKQEETIKQVADGQ
jgi:parvulin-like peptidyl-prolyl isomerase